MKRDKVDIVAQTLGVIFLLVIGYNFLAKDWPVDCDSERAKDEVYKLVVEPLSGSANFDLTLKNISQVLRAKNGDTHCRATMFLHKEDNILDIPIKYSFYKSKEGRLALSLDIADEATFAQQVGWKVIADEINARK